MSDFEEPAYIRDAVNSLSSDQQIVANYVLNHIQALRCSRHDFSNRVPALEVKMDSLDNKIDILITKLEPIAHAKTEVDGGIKLLKLIGLGTFSAGFLGVFVYIFNKLGGS